MKSQRAAALFVQCIVDGLYPEVAESVVRVLERVGVPVTCPPQQTCCGQPAFNAGYRQAARKAARHFIRVFEREAVIVCPSGSCVHMVRDLYPVLFREERAWERRAREVGRRTFEFTEYLVDVLGVTDVGARFTGTLTYHDSCQLARSLGIVAQPRKLLENLEGARFVEMTDSDRCCGFGGSFSVKYPDVSTALLEDKVNNILASGAEVVTGCDMGCLMNIGSYLRRRALPIRTMHIAQLLAGTP